MFKKGLFSQVRNKRTKSHILSNYLKVLWMIGLKTGVYCLT